MLCLGHKSVPCASYKYGPHYARYSYESRQPTTKDEALNLWFIVPTLKNYRFVRFCGIITLM